MLLLHDGRVIHWSMVQISHGPPIRSTACAHDSAVSAVAFKRGDYAVTTVPATSNGRCAYRHGLASADNRHCGAWMTCAKDW